MEQDWTATYYKREEDCGKEVRADQDWTLPPCDPVDPSQGWFIRTDLPATEMAEITDVAENCNSKLERHWAVNEKTYRVEGKVLGCGYLIWCKGRGWLGYTLRIKRARGFKLSNLQAYSENRIVTGQKSFTFRYPSSYIPQGSHSFQWQYMVTVVFPDRVANVSHTNPNAAGVTTRISADGTLAVELT